MPTRAESGPVQFGDDWTGIFLRGDYAGPMTMTLLMVIDAIDRNEKPSLIDLITLRGFAEVLAESDERGKREAVQLLLPFEECLVCPRPV